MVGEISGWMKKAKPVVYVRISNKEQAGADAGKEPKDMPTLQSQVKIIKQGLKDNGMKMPNKEDVFFEVASGGDRDRPVWREAIAHALGKKGRTYIAVKEPARWARDQTWGEEAYAPLKAANIPLFSTMDSLPTSTVSEPRPTEHFFWAIKSGVVESERGVTVQKAGEKQRELRESGIYPSGGPLLYPFAAQDPLDVMIPLAHRQYAKAKDGGLSKEEIGRRIMADTAPHGPKKGWWKKEHPRHLERWEKLTPEEYATWYDFRKKVRALEKEYDYDGSGLKEKDGRKGNVHWGIRAMRYRANGFLRHPESDLYRMPTDEEMKEWMTNPRDYLSESDKRVYTKIVSHR